MVVVDSSALIPLARIGRLSLLCQVFEKVHTPKHVYKETVLQGKGKRGTSILKEAFNTWIATETVADPLPKEIAELEGIATPDASVIVMAERHEDMLLANDKALIQVARSRGVQCYWLTTFLLHCVRRDILSTKEGKQFLHDLIQEDMTLSTKVYARLLQEIEEA